MNYCSSCGARVVLRIPSGENLPRHVCVACEAIHYENPKLVVGCIAEWQGRILICRRAIEPRHGLWTLPAGFMENHESCAEAAARETMEEACAEIEPGPPFALIDVPHISQVHLFYRAQLRNERHAPGPESLETALIEEHEIPWTQLAFRSVEFALRRYLDDRRRGDFGMHTLVLQPPPGV